jgi:hypothetical protein
MRKNLQYVVQMPIPEINLNLGASVQPFALRSVSSSPNSDKDKYPMDDIKDPTPCALMYVKGRTSRTIEVAKAIVMPSHILHGRPAPVECAVVKVSMIREGREFEDLDYANEDDGIERLVDAKGTFILFPGKYIIVKTHSLPIVLPWSTKVGGTPTSNLPKPVQNSHTSLTPPLLKTVKTQRSKRARGEGRLLLLQKILKAQSSRRARGESCLLLQKCLKA